MAVAFEQGLYGQDERRERWASDHAFAERIADVESEGETTHEGIPTEAHFRRRFALVACKEIKASNRERQLETWLDSITDRHGNIIGGGRNALNSVMWRSVTANLDQLRSAVQEYGIVHEEMRQAGYADALCDAAYRAGLPVAFNILREERTAFHKSVEAKKARLRTPPKGYNIDECAAMYGERPKVKKGWK